MNRALLAAFFFACSGAAALCAGIPPGERRSGYDFMTPETKAMQDDDTANPASLSVLQGETLWRKKEGAANKACADCHNEAEKSMQSVAARYPAFEPKSGGPIDLSQRINLCRSEHQNAPPFAYESKELLALSAYIARQSRGDPIAAPSDPRLTPFVEKGRAQFMRRRGQLNFACTNCHDDNWGKKLAGAVIPQGHPTGYPIYRLEWQSMGSLQRRLRGCFTGMRAEAFPYGAQDYVELELYLKARAAGMKMDAPGVRP